MAVETCKISALMKKALTRCNMVDNSKEDAVMTPKQEKFAQLYVELGSSADAYRGAYNAEKMKDATVYRRAHDLLEHGKIKARIETIREAARERNKVTVDSLLAELEEARQIALGAETPQAGAAVGATMGKAKLVGLDKQILDLRSGDGSMTPRPTTIQIVAADDNNAD